MSDSRVLIKGGHVITMDPALGELDGDILVEDGRIVAVAPAIDASDARVIDAAGGIVVPGFVDTHRHTWQTQLRALVTDMTLNEYMCSVRQGISTVYRAEDIYHGNLVGAVEALDAGVTTILDYSHCTHSPAHADAAIAGLRDAGIRAVYAYGYSAAPVDEPGFADDTERIGYAHRLREEYFSSDDSLLTMAVAISETGTVPWETTTKEVRSAKELSALLTSHTGCFWGSQCTAGVRELHMHGLLGENQVHAHCNTLIPYEFQLLADAGARVSSTPESELTMGLGQPVFQQCLDHGIEPTLGCDMVSLNSGDMFAPMRLALHFQRCAINSEINARGEMPDYHSLNSRDVLRWATQSGADACGLGSKVGSLSEGKEADIVVIGPHGLNLTPLADPAGGIVTMANAGNVEAVLVGGRIVKEGGLLVTHDPRSLATLIEGSREFLFDAAQAKGPIRREVPEGWFHEVNVMAAGNLAGAYALSPAEAAA